MSSVEHPGVGSKPLVHTTLTPGLDWSQDAGSGDVGVPEAGVLRTEYVVDGTRRCSRRSPQSAVDLRRREKRTRGLQYLIGSV